MSNVTKSFTPGVKSSLVVNNTTVTCYLRDYMEKDKFTVVEEKSWDFSEAADSVTAYLLNYGVTQKLNDAAAMPSKANPTPKKKHDKRVEMMELLKKGVVKLPRAGKINKEALGIAKGLKLAGLSKEDAQKALANQPDIPTVDIEYSINVAFEE